MQTRYQKNLEKIAVEALLSLSQGTMEFRLNLNEYSENERNEGRSMIAKNYCRDKLNGYDKPMPELVKYCPYNGSYEDQIKQCIEHDNIEVYDALIEYKNQIEKYDSIKKYLENNYKRYMNNVTNAELLNYLQIKG
jgi:hypothetical protein